MKVRWFACAAAVLTLALSARAAEKSPAPEKPAGDTPAPDKPAAAEPKAPRDKQIERIVHIKDVERMRTFRDLASAFGALAVEFRDLGFLVLRGPAASVDAAQAAIAKYDAARPHTETLLKTVEFTAYLVLASPRGGATTVPEPLAPVVERMKGVFPYNGYTLVDTVMLRVDGSGKVTGQLPKLSGDQELSAPYFLEFKNARVMSRGEGGATIGVGVHLNVDVPSMAPVTDKETGRVVPGAVRLHYRQNHIETSINIREGQKVVVGKSAIDGAGNALILVLTAKLD